MIGIGTEIWQQILNQQTSIVTPPVDNFLLLEDGFNLLLEDGDKLLLEN